MVILLPNDKDASALPKLQREIGETQKNFDAICEAIQKERPREVRVFS